VPIGSEGLIILPFLMGERTPIWDAYARGVIFGLSLNHTKGHIVRAMMEAVAYALYDSYQLIKKSGIKINYPLVLNEGGTVSKLWRQIISDVFNSPLVLVKRRTGAPFGDAILAGVATNLGSQGVGGVHRAYGTQPGEPRAVYGVLRPLQADIRAREG
jgi:xylulokinase